MDRFNCLTASLEGTHLIEAGAGTGKTWNITALWLRLLLEKKLPVQRILVVTFTRAATAELRERIRDRLLSCVQAFSTGDPIDDPVIDHLLRHSGDRRADLLLLQKALIFFDEASLFTIHGYCQRALSDFAFECGQPLTMEVVADTGRVVKQAVEDFWRTNVLTQDRFFLRTLFERKITPDFLTTFLQGKRTHPDVRIVGPEQRDPEAAQDCEAAFTAAAEIWRRERDEVLEQLSPKRMKGAFSSKNFPAHVRRLDLFFGRGSLTSVDKNIFEILRKLAPENLPKSVKKGEEPPEHPFFTAAGLLYLSLYYRKKEEEALLAELYRKLLADVPPVLEKQREISRVRGYDDLLLDLHRSLHGSSGSLLKETLAENWPVALIDEFQDTDPLQYEIFDAVYGAGGQAIFYIGDPKQAIYAFRGADIFTYLRAAAATRNQHALTCNWRSVPRLVQAVNSLFRMFDDASPFAFDAIRYQPLDAADCGLGRFFPDAAAEDTTPLRLWCLPDKDVDVATAERVAVDKTAEAICHLLDKGYIETEGQKVPVKESDIVILVRKRKQAVKMRSRLSASGINAVVSGDESLFSAAVARSLYLFLAAVLNPADEGLVRAALLTPLFATDVEKILPVQGDGDFERWWESLYQHFDDYRQMWQQGHFMEMVRQFLRDFAVRPRLLSTADGLRQLTDLMHIVEILHVQSATEKSGCEGLLNWLQEQLDNPASTDEYRRRLETDEKLLSIMTIHNSKGLEFPVVFCPFLWGGVNTDSNLFHHPDQTRSLMFNCGSEEGETFKEYAQREALAEDVRLIYVALTRARYQATFFYAKIRAASALSWLLFRQGGDLPEMEVVKKLASLEVDEKKGRLAVLQNVSGQTLSVETVHSGLTGEERTVRQQDSGRFLLQLPAPPRRIGKNWRITSFSSLVAGHYHHIDHPHWEEQSDGEDLPPSAEEGSFLHFPKGAAAGTCLHSILEEISFADSAHWQDKVAELLERYGYEDRFVPAVEQMLHRLVAVPLSLEDKRHRLVAVADDDFKPEIEFHLPLQTIDHKALADVFAAHGMKDFARQLTELTPLRVEGMLKGFIDLVYRYDDRYWIIDWKSNHLGFSPEDYRPDSLAEVIDREFYRLQYALYTVALHRFLAVRIPGYHYETHMGGVQYLFLRAFSFADAGDCGVWRDRPSLDFVEQLSSVLSGGGEQ